MMGLGQSHEQTMMRDSRTGPAARGLDPDRAVDHVRALGSDQLQAVVPRISASILHEPPPASAEAVVPDAAAAAEPRATTLDVDGAWTTIAAVPLGRLYLVVAAAASLAAGFVAGDARVALASGLLVCACWVLWKMGRWIPFSFGEGFVGYRSDLGWPPGVQEEDDVHWDWRSPAASSWPAPEAMSRGSAAGGRD
jgi:hypothetical protein